MSRTMSAKEREFGRRMSEWLLLKRTSLGMFQHDLAEELGVHRNTYRRWESAEASVPAFAIQEIKRLLKERGVQ